MRSRPVALPDGPKIVSARACEDVVDPAPSLLLWAIERLVDGIELVAPDAPATPAPADAPPGQIVATGARRYRYLPSTTVPPFWHPYVTSDAGNVRRFVQGRLADLDVRPVAPRAGPTRRLVRDPAATPADPSPQIAPGTVPRGGLRLDRRHVLGRRTDGQPLLWVQRRRAPLSGAGLRAALGRARRDPRDPGMTLATRLPRLGSTRDGNPSSRSWAIAPHDRNPATAGS